MQFLFTLLLMCCQTALRLAEWCSLPSYDRERRLPPVSGVLFLTTLDFRTVRTWFLFLINWTASSFLLQQQKQSKTTGQVWIDWGPGTVTPLPITPHAPCALTRFQGDGDPTNLTTQHRKSLQFTSKEAARTIRGRRVLNWFWSLKVKALWELRQGHTWGQNSDG